MMNTMHKSLCLLALPVLLGGCASSTGGYGAMHTPAAVMAASQPLPTTADDRVMYMQLIRKMQTRGLYYASLAHIDAYARRYGDTPQLAILRADALRETRQPDAAAAIYRKLRDGPQAAAAWHGLGLVAADKGQYAQAVEYLTKAVHKAPINAAYLGDLGYARLRAGDVNGAREPLAKAAELDAGSTKAVANLALLLMVQGKTRKAESMMQKAKLPQATRQAVMRQAVQLRRQYSQTARTTPATAPSSDTTASAPSSRMAANDVPRTYGISANILDRFSQPTAAGESRHEPR